MSGFCTSAAKYQGHWLAQCCLTVGNNPKLYTNYEKVEAVIVYACALPTIFQSGSTAA